MQTGHLPRPALLLLAALVLNAGCALIPPRKKELPKPPPPTVPAQARKSYWQSEGVQGEPSIVVALGEQRAYFFKGNTVVGDTHVSSGKKSFETPPGTYQVLQKDKNHASNLYGSFVDAEGEVVKSNVDMSKDKVPEGASFKGAKMPYFLRFHDGYGMHAGRVPSYRASHGCVRLPAWIAPHFFENAEIGTPVTVTD